MCICYTVLIQFWEDYNVCVCIKNLAWASGDVTREYMHHIWKKTLKRFLCDFKELARGEETAKISRAVVEMANNCEDHSEELPGGVPGGLTNEGRWDRTGTNS